MFYSFEKGKQYTGKSLCTSYLFQNRKTNIKILFQFLFFLLSFKKGKQYTGKFLCTVYLFQKRKTNTKMLFQFLFFEKGKQYTEIFLCTVYLFQKSNTQKQKYYLKFFTSCSLLQRKISVYCFPFSKE